MKLDPLKWLFAANPSFIVFTLALQDPPQVTMRGQLRMKPFVQKPRICVIYVGRLYNNLLYMELFRWNHRWHLR